MAPRSPTKFKSPTKPKTEDTEILERIRGTNTKDPLHYNNIKPKKLVREHITSMVELVAHIKYMELNPPKPITELSKKEIMDLVKSKNPRVYLFDVLRTEVKENTCDGKVWIKTPRSSMQRKVFLHYDSNNPFYSGVGSKCFDDFDPDDVLFKFKMGK